MPQKSYGFAGFVSESHNDKKFRLLRLGFRKSHNDKKFGCHDLPSGKSRNDDLFFYKSADSRNDEKCRLPRKTAFFLQWRIYFWFFFRLPQIAFAMQGLQANLTMTIRFWFTFDFFFRFFFYHFILLLFFTFFIISTLECNLLYKIQNPIKKEFRWVLG